MHVYTRPSFTDTTAHTTFSASAFKSSSGSSSCCTVGCCMQVRANLSRLSRGQVLIPACQRGKKKHSLHDTYLPAHKPKLHCPVEVYFQAGLKGPKCPDWLPRRHLGRHSARQLVQGKKWPDRPSTSASSQLALVAPFLSATSKPFSIHQAEPPHVQ